ncbi:trypsin-like serine peptidase [Streptomyces olivoreticuli]|uniref:trypsin-like serine peptidase n=1 Tax=Streptomyces olivoreticuli TaxID=68246 RepID=UPI000E233F25|nr:FG-GAP-like repeat-containing protein [Streptomyces olivoreticuli]
MSPFRWSRTVAVALCMAACGTTATATAAVATTPATPGGRAAEKYWTAERMAAAKPADAGRAAAPASAARARALVGAAPTGTPQGAYGDGIPMVGTFFSSTGPDGPTYCTASVVHSAGRNLVLTAGHCAKSLAGGGQRIFVPQYRKGLDATHQPYGVFPVDRVFTDPRYTKNSKGPDSSLDFGFARVLPNTQGAAVEDRTGALRLTPTPRWTSTVTVTGYPGSHNPDQKAVSCTVPTSRLAGYRQLQMKCGGFYGGTSGSPWITNYDAKSRTGDVIGNLGGWNGGGNATGDDWISYSPVYDHEIQDLYQDAIADRTPVRAPYQSPADTARLPGAASTWSHAKFLAPGDYDGDGRDDLLTVWSDGEVTLYPGDGKGGFGAEKQLAKPKSYWQRAQAVTSGDFSGTGRPDVLVRWDTGKVSYYEDVDPAGFDNKKEYTLAAGGSAWKDAAQITVGRFNSTDRANDMIVRWADGKVTLHSDVSPAGTGTERRLADSGSFWRNSTALAATFPAGRDRSQVVVRWADGSLGSFALSGSGLTGTRLQAPNPSWASPAMTAGDFGGAGRADGLLVRWADGETSLYDGTAADTLGTWNPLVNTG